jgi:hypothetical protein
MMMTPQNVQQFTFVLDTTIDDESLREMIKQFVLEEFRRGYLYGQREMKLAAENALTSLHVDNA